MITAENLSIMSTTHQVGTGEFGPVFMELLKVCVTMDNGARFVHRKSFPCGEVDITEDGFTKVFDQSEAAEEKAQTLLSRIVIAGVINLEFWEEIDPAYASEEYIQRGVEFERWLEERAEA